VSLAPPLVAQLCSSAPPTDVTGFRAPAPHWVELRSAPSFECAGVLEDAVSATPSLHADTWTLELIESADGSLRVAAVHHPLPSRARVNELALRAAPRLAAAEWSDDEVHAARAGECGSLSFATRARRRALRAHSSIRVPLCIEGRVVGSLSVARDTGPSLSERDTVALACCALQIEACWHEALAALSERR